LDTGVLIKVKYALVRWRVYDYLLVVITTS